MVEFRHNGSLGGQTTTSLTPGVFDDVAEDVFLSGHCHSFALALQELLGGDVVLATDGLAYHVALEVEDGVFLDARGRVDVNDLHEYGDIEPITREEIEAEVDFVWFPLEVEKAMSFADALVERLGLARRCTGTLYYEDGLVTHDGDTCPIHEAEVAVAA